MMPVDLLKRAWVGAAAFSEATGIPLRTIQHWCKTKRISAARRGPKLWFINMRKLRELREGELAEIILDSQAHAVLSLGDEEDAA